MRPEKKRSSKPQYGVSRARLLLKKNLGWLPGFPVEVGCDTVRWHAWPWKDPGTSQLVSLDREALRRMEMALGKLRYHFPRALLQIVEDVDEWLARMDGLLEMLKGAIHHQSPMDVETLLAVPAGGGRWVQRFRRLRAARPELVPLLDAVAFLEFTDRRRCDPPVLEWIDSRAVGLSRLVANGETSLILPLMLCTLREDIDASLLTFLLDAMADASFCSSLSGNNYHDYLVSLSNTVKKAANGESFELPRRSDSPTLGDTWEHFLRQLLEMKPKNRRRVTGLLGLIVPADLVLKTRAMDLQDRKEEFKFLKILRQHQCDGFLSSWTGGKRKEVKKLLEFQWSGTRHQLLEDVTFALDHIATVADQEKHLGVWMRFLSFLPTDEYAIRLRLFVKWEKERLRWGDSDAAETNQQLQQILSELSRLFSRRGVHRWLLRHWRRYIRVTNRLAGMSDRWTDQWIRLLTASFTAVDLLHEDDDGRTYIPQWTRLLEAMVYDQDLRLGDKLFGSLDEFARGAPDINRAKQLVSTLAALEDDGYCADDIRASFAIASEDSDLPMLLKKLGDDDELRDSVNVLGQHLRDRRLRRIIERWLLKDRKKALIRLASCAQVVVGLGLSIPKIPEIESSADWLTRYPIALQGVLGDLCQITADAEAIAAQLLGKEFPAHDDLQREARIIREKLTAAAAEQNGLLRARLQQRLENLQHRMEQPPQVTPRRLGNLAGRICDRVDHEVVKRYVQECHTLIGEKLEERYGFRLLPERLFESSKEALLSGILQLGDPMKELGLRLLCKSSEDPTCDFRTEPRNIAFLESLKKQGIRVEPWLDESFQQTAKTANAEPYRLFFTRHIDDILLMGFHFDTCLSPQDMNFFSTIANAVDINKQVVYAKTALGRVVGRCLFALTDSGGLLTYRRYAHDPKDGFKKQVDQFAERLAEAMKTRLVDSGRVLTLVARGWYDDGAVPRDVIYNLQNVDGPVRSILRTEAAARILEKLIGVFESEEVLRDLLGSLLLLEEFQERREIIGPFLDRFAFEPSIRMSVRFRLAILARLAGKEGIAARIIKSLRINSLPKRLKRIECCCCGVFHGIGSYDEVFDLLINCNPSIALRTLRLTRPRGVKSDADEENPKRKEILTRCYQVLRPSS